MKEFEQKISEDITEIKVNVAKIQTSLKYRLKFLETTLYGSLAVWLTITLTKILS